MDPRLNDPSDPFKGKGAALVTQTTGMGKSLCGGLLPNWARHVYERSVTFPNDPSKLPRLLIMVPSTNLFQNWKNEIKKWYPAFTDDMFWPNSKTKHEGIDAPSQEDMADPKVCIFFVTYDRLKKWESKKFVWFEWKKYGLNMTEEDKEDPLKVFAVDPIEREAFLSSEDCITLKNGSTVKTFSGFYDKKRMNSKTGQQKHIIKDMKKNLASAWNDINFMRSLWLGFKFHHVIGDEIHFIRNRTTRGDTLVSLVPPLHLLSPYQRNQILNPNKAKKGGKKGKKAKKPKRPQKHLTTPYIHDMMEYQCPGFEDATYYFLSGTLFNNSMKDWCVPAILCGEPPFNNLATWSKNKETTASIPPKFSERFFANGLEQTKKNQKECYLAWVSSQFAKSPVNIYSFDASTQQKIFGKYLDRLKAKYHYITPNVLDIWDISGEVLYMKLKPNSSNTGDGLKKYLTLLYVLFQRFSGPLCPELSGKKEEEEEPEAQEEGNGVDDDIDDLEDEDRELSYVAGEDEGNFATENPAASNKMFTIQLAQLLDVLWKLPSLVFLDPKSSLEEYERKRKEFQSRTVTQKRSVDKEEQYKDKEAIRDLNDPIYPDHGFMWFVTLLCGDFTDEGTPANDFLPPSLVEKHRLYDRFQLLNMPLKEAPKKRWNESRKTYDAHPVLILDPEIQIMKLWYEHQKHNKNWNQNPKMDGIAANCEVLIDIIDDLIEVLAKNLKTGAFSCKSIFKFFLLLSMVMINDTSYFKLVTVEEEDKKTGEKIKKRIHVFTEMSKTALRTVYYDERASKYAVSPDLIPSSTNPLDKFVVDIKLDRHWLLSRPFVKHSIITPTTGVPGKKAQKAYLFEFEKKPFLLTEHIMVQNHLFQKGLLEFSWDFIRNLHFVVGLETPQFAQIGDLIQHLMSHPKNERGEPINPNRKLIVFYRDQRVIVSLMQYLQRRFQDFEEPIIMKKISSNHAEYHNDILEFGKIGPNCLNVIFVPKGTAAGNNGLEVANCVLLLEGDEWNPMLNHQAASRAMRVTQKNQVFIWKFSNQLPGFSSTDKNVCATVKGVVRDFASGKTLTPEGAKNLRQLVTQSQSTTKDQPPQFNQPIVDMSTIHTTVHALKTTTEQEVVSFYDHDTDSEREIKPKKNRTSQKKNETVLTHSSSESETDQKRQNSPKRKAVPEEEEQPEDEPEITVDDEQIPSFVNPGKQEVKDGSSKDAKPSKKVKVDKKKKKQIRVQHEDEEDDQDNELLGTIHVTPFTEDNLKEILSKCDKAFAIGYTNLAMDKRTNLPIIFASDLKKPQYKANKEQLNKPDVLMSVNPVAKKDKSNMPLVTYVARFVNPDDESKKSFTLAPSYTFKAKTNLKFMTMDPNKYHEQYLETSSDCKSVVFMLIVPERQAPSGGQVIRYYPEECYHSKGRNIVYHNWVGNLELRTKNTTLIPFEYSDARQTDDHAISLQTNLIHKM